MYIQRRLLLSPFQLICESSYFSNLIICASQFANRDACRNNREDILNSLQNNENTLLILLRPGVQEFSFLGDPRTFTRERDAHGNEIEHFT